jgi:hypothetical protein
MARDLSKLAACATVAMSLLAAPALAQDPTESPGDGPADMGIGDGVLGNEGTMPGSGDLDVSEDAPLGGLEEEGDLLQDDSALGEEVLDDPALGDGGVLDGPGTEGGGLGQPGLGSGTGGSALDSPGAGAGGIGGDVGGGLGDL